MIAVGLAPHRPAPMPRPAPPRRSRPRRSGPRRLARLLTGAAAFAAAALPAAAAPPASTILSTYQPKVAGGTGVDIETPPEAQWEQCTVEPIRGRDSGYVVAGPQGQTLRRIVDADGDGTIELFIYYNQGMEVYREWDADGADQNANGGPVVNSNNFRWVNFGGTKWGVDVDGDRKVDRWNRISPAEAAAVAAGAVIEGDAAMLSTVLVTRGELEALEVVEPIIEDVAEKLADPARQLAEMRRGSAMLQARPTFESVNTGQPGLILPGESGRRELEVIENSNALVNVPGDSMGIVSLSEMVRVGDRYDGGRLVEAGQVWKLTALPRPVEGNGQIVLGGPLIQPVAGREIDPNDPGLDPKVAELLRDLQKLNAERPADEAADQDKKAFAAKQLSLHRALFAADKSDDRPFWLTTQADTFHGLFLADLIDEKFAQTELNKLRQLAATEAKPVLPVVDHRKLYVEWTDRRRELGEQAAPAALAAFAEWWQDERKAFIADYPDAGESAVFLLELGMEAEQEDEESTAVGYYRKIVQQFPGTPIGAKAAGALRRLGLEGKPLEFSAPLRGGGTVTERDTRGKVTLLTFWNVDCKPCQQNLPILKDLYDRYGRDLAIVAVNVDETPNPIAAYVADNKVPFPVAYEPGGFDSPLATRFGVVNLPTMLLADKSGRVVAVNPTIRDVQTKVPELVK